MAGRIPPIAPSASCVTSVGSQRPDTPRASCQASHEPSFSGIASRTPGRLQSATAHLMPENFPAPRPPHGRIPGVCTPSPPIEGPDPPHGPETIYQVQIGKAPVSERQNPHPDPEIEGTVINHMMLYVSWAGATARPRSLRTTRPAEHLILSTGTSVAPAPSFNQPH